MRRASSPLPRLAGVLLVAVCLFGQAPQGSGSHLGVFLKNIDADRAHALKLSEVKGVEVQRVEPDSPAAAAGLQPGDVLLTYNGEQILSALQVGRLVGETPPGHKVKVQYWREGKTGATMVAPVAGPPPGNDLPPDFAGGPIGPVNVPRVLVVWDNLALGVECEPLDAQLAEYFGVPGGILVREVGKGLLGDKAGLKAGDVITGVDTRSVAAPADFISYLRAQNAAPGKTMVVQIVRDHKKRSLSILLRE